MTDKSNGRPSSKVARLLEEYDLQGFGTELEARWTGEGYERMSLRALATLFNERVLEQALIEAGMSTLENDVETIYRNLTASDVSTGTQTETRHRLERNGIDVEKLKRDFVTYQAIRTYLKEWRDAEYETISDEEKIENDIETIQRLMTRTQSVTEDRIESLARTDRIRVDDFEVFLRLEVLCQNCGTQYDVIDLLERGGCDCQENTN